MSIIQAFILGMVQGLTEFLPVSSSGHLVIFQHLFGMQDAPITFDVLLHLGTLVAVFIAFWGDIAAIIKKPFSRLTFLIVVGCIPAALLGFYLEPLFTAAFESLLVVGIGLLFTGIILKVSDYASEQLPGLKQSNESSYLDVLIIGLLQGLAIVPGISRSGSTIAGGLLRGLERDFAARFSFLLSIPVIIGAAVVQLKDLFYTGLTGTEFVPYAVGITASAGFGYLAIKTVMKLVKKGRLSIFSYYCWIIGLVAIVAYFIF